ncbi:response regulator transcription factor [Sulfurimonas sp.]|jgi:DNA-binding response OmpR family regulator|uniref:response regulator transcription factor n=1 Tax=Sulfurimonas sp. TaxID=2022749 RepID=UPI0025DD997F|nr:response regulator transcription factor [Sulfurimonas sp.]MCK9472741.1 response regulator transcription factor [Sulfurimonas sp.]MDD3505443.1 response regulator transcription factor [Sulfurimonas sp.]
MKVEKIKDMSILLAEDETELRETLSEYLQIFFSRVYTAACGNEAYDIYKQKRPEIILTDINMPNLDGLDMIAKIRKDDKETRIIVMSAHSDQEKLLSAIKLHLETYLIKPIKTDALKNILLGTVNLIRKTTNKIYISETIFWDYDTDTLWKNNKEIKLRKMETLLLKLLFSEPNHCFSGKDIFISLHEEKKEKEFSSHAITSLMKRIRTKLPEGVIHNIYGSGYKVIPV